MMKKIFKFFVVLLMLVTFSFGIASCSSGDPAKTEFIVTFDSTGGSKVEAQKVKLSEKAIEPNDPFKEGFNFNGWYLDDIKYDFNTLVSSDITLIAHWNEITSFNVIFDTDGGSLIPTAQVEKNALVTKPSDPTKSGYTFKGWYLGEEAFDFSTYKVTSNITIKAHWEVEQEKAKVYTVAEIIALCKENNEERYLVRGTIKKISNPQYGEMTLEDETGEIYVFGTYSADGEIRYPELEDKPLEGDEILLSTLAVLYNGKPELKSAWILEVKHNAPQFNEADYTEMTIKAAREAAIDAKVKLTGTVAQITYASGHKPSGVMLVDNTGSIYVYDMMIASEAKVGNTLTVCGDRDSWINPDEQNSANKFGYKGCTQISKCHKISLDKGVNDVDYSWVEESSVKAIIENDPKNDITSTIFKVNGYVKKAINPGFVNYYINDIDGKTGSYVYTQCNGGDFAWLDEFDGKICSIYLSPLNAKATGSGVQYRFLPIKVTDENYKFDLSNSAAYALEYEVLPLLGNDYKLDPSLELPISISNSILGIENVEISYTSANEEAVYFEILDNKVLMHTKNTADLETEITITATYNDIVKSVKYLVKTFKTPDIKFDNVISAINAEVGSEVIIKGIVGASLVNQDGFYLIDETGAIAVKTTTTELASLKLGNMVIIKGIRTLWGKKDKTPYQVCVKDATVELNAYGNYKYSDSSFITGKSLADIKALAVSDVKNSASVYAVADCEIKVVETPYYTSILLTQGDVELNLYSSSAKQYNWLKDFAGKKITVHIAPCDWNSKSNYSGCVLAVILEDGTRVVNSLNFK